MSDPLESPAETPESKRDKLPEGLRDIPLSDVDTVASLPLVFLKPLADAYVMEKFDLPRAVEYINTSKSIFITPEEICEAARFPKPEPAIGGNDAQKMDTTTNSLPAGAAVLVEAAPTEKPKATTPIPQEETWNLPYAVQPTQQDVDNLVSLLKLCYTDMPRLSAESLVQADLFRETLVMATVARIIAESKYATAEYLLLAQAFVLNQLSKTVLETINKNPSLKMKLEEREQLLDHLKFHS